MAERVALRLLHDDLDGRAIELPLRELLREQFGFGGVNHRDNVGILRQPRFAIYDGRDASDLLVEATQLAVLEEHRRRLSKCLKLLDHKQCAILRTAGDPCCEVLTANPLGIFRATAARRRLPAGRFLLLTSAVRDHRALERGYGLAFSRRIARHLRV